MVKKVDNLEKMITLRCPVCGNDQFSAVDENIEDLRGAPDETRIKCSDCGCIKSKEELIEGNSELINANVEDFKEDIVKQLQKKLKRMFK